MKTLAPLAVLLFTLPAFADSVTISLTPGTIVEFSQNTLFACNNCGSKNDGFAFDVYDFGTPSASGWVYLKNSILFVGGFTSTHWDATTNTLTAAFSGYVLACQANGNPSSFGKTLVTGVFTEHIIPCTSNCNGVFGTTGEGSIELSAMPPAVPEPSALVLVGTGLVGAGWKGLKTVIGSRR